MTARTAVITAIGRPISRTAARPATRTFPRSAATSATRTTRRCGRSTRARRKLGGAWVNRIEGGLTTGTNQSTPVVVDGVIYIESALGNVVAVDGKTGATKWKYTTPFGSLTRRGVAVARASVLHAGERQPRDRARTRTPAQVGQGVRQHRDGFGNVEKVALVYHDKRLYIGTNDGDRGAALSVDATNGNVLGTSGACRARRDRLRHLGRRTGWRAARRRGSTRRSIPS